MEHNKNQTVNRDHEVITMEHTKFSWNHAQEAYKSGHQENKQQALIDAVQYLQSITQFTITSYSYSCRSDLLKNHYYDQLEKNIPATIDESFRFELMNNMSTLLNKPNVDQLIKRRVERAHSLGCGCFVCLCLIGGFLLFIEGLKYLT